MKEIRSDQEIREKVFAEAWKHGSVSGDLKSSWAQAREEQASALLSRSLEEAQGLLGAELQDVETELQRLEDGAHGNREAAFRAATDLGQRLRWGLWLGDVVSAELTLDPGSNLEEELDRIEARGEDLARLDSRFEDAAVGIADRAQEERRRLLGCRLSRLVEERFPERAESALESASRRWQLAMEAFQLEARLLEEDCFEGDRSPAFCSGTDVETLARRRSDHLADCAERLTSCSAPEVAEFAHAAAADLLDNASGLLAERTTAEMRLRIPVLDVLCQQIRSFHEVLGEWDRKLGQRGVLEPELRRRFRKDVRQLARLTRHARNAETESRVHQRLVGLFGQRSVRLFENFIFVSIFAFLALVAVEWGLPEGHAWLRTIAILDLIFCVCFQIDFFTRWACSGWSFSYFLRHFFVESLPAFPYGFLFFYVEPLRELGEVRAVIIARLLRLQRLGRLRPLILLLVRVFRIIVFFVRGTDRAVERFRPLLDQDIVLFDPNPIGDAPESPLRRRALGLETRRLRYVRNFYMDLPWEERARYLRSHVTLVGAEAGVSGSLDLPHRRGLQGGSGEIQMERLIHNFLDCDVARTIGMVGRDGVRRLARWLRFLDLPGLRRAPIIRRLVPAARILNPAEAVSAAANAMGEALQGILGGLRFWGDLSGITTGPQILDRVATAMIMATKRPALRLLTVGGLFALVWCLSLPFKGFLTSVATALGKILGVPILVLGGVCLVFLLLGRWMKRIAGEALDVYLRASDAQFYPLLKARKHFRLRRDVETLFRSVLRPERALRSRDEPSDEEWVNFLSEPLAEKARFLPGSAPPTDARFQAFAGDRETIALLYRDFLDGPVLHRSDDKTSVQLLGNLVLQEVRAQTLGMGGKELRKLERLVLEGRGAFTLGPAFWFRFITESLAIETAKLIMEYNTTCIPRDQLHLATPEKRRHFEVFLAEHRGKADSTWRRFSDERRLHYGAPLTASNFTAFDFLGPSSQSDENVRLRYGDEVLEALRRDRCGVVRDIFGTRPYHLLPRNQRVFNPYRLYRKYLGGAKFLLLPIVLLVAAARLGLFSVRQVWNQVEDVLGRRRVLRSHLSRFAGFDVAVRKINRMRKPFFMEALRLRAEIDVAYLGLRLPGQERDDDAVTYRDHLDFIGALESERRPLEELRNRAVRDLRRFRIFLADRGWLGPGLEELLDQLDPSGELRSHRSEVLRALVTAYITDHACLRSVLTAPEWAREFVETALRGPGDTLGRRLEVFVLCDLMAFLPRNLRRRRLFRAYAELDPSVKSLARRDRRRLLRKFLQAGAEDERMLDIALRGLRHESQVGEDSILAALKETALEYSLWTRKLITVRTIQTITVLDVESYREMVWEIGGYADDNAVRVTTGEESRRDGQGPERIPNEELRMSNDEVGDASRSTTER